MHLYETAIVFDSQAKSEEIEERINNVKNFITNHGGTIVSSEEVGKRRLAYEINKKQYGYYIYIRFNAQGNLIALLEREYRLSENVLRYLTLKIDKNQILAEEKSAGEQSDKGEKQVKLFRLKHQNLSRKWKKLKKLLRNQKLRTSSIRGTSRC